MRIHHFRLFILGLVLMFASSAYVSAKSTVDDGVYTQKNKEYYLTAEETSFIRPGLVMEILDIDIPADRRPFITFSMKDPGGLPLDREGIYTPGPVDVRFMLTFIPQGEEQKVTYHDRSRDRDGEYGDLGDGVYTYKFTTVLPEDWDPDATHTLGTVARRDLREFDLDRYVDNVVTNFVPSGNGQPMPRDIVTTETCNGRCHDPLAMHGGRYQEVGVCTQCHNPGLFDEEEGVSYSYDVMIHRVHEELDEEGHYPAPLNDCETCHTGGTPTNDFPLVTTPAPIAVCDQSARGVTTRTWRYPEVVELRLNSPEGPLVGRGRAGSQETGKWIKDDTEFFVVDEASGEVLQELPLDLTVFGCAGGAPGTFRGEPGTQHTNWMTRPSRLVCGSCHKEVDFETGEGHSEFEFPVNNDDDCKFCHKPTSGVEYDRTLQRAHTVDYKSNQLGGLQVDILNIESTGPGEFPMVTFSLFDKSGPLDPAGLDWRIRFSISGPNEDFTVYWQEDATDDLVPGAAEAAGDPTWVYTFEAPMPDDATGSFTLGMEGRINDVVINEGTDKEFEMEDQMQNFVVPFAVMADGVAAEGHIQPRRMIVDDQKCENCHTNLSLHGSNRHEVQYCVTCHRPDATDWDERTDENQPPQSVHFKYMIHKIHRGQDLENGYVVLGYNKSVHDYSDVEFPGDLRNCENCHVNDSQLLPLPAGLEPTTSPRDYWDLMLPETAACLSCHDKLSAAAHAETNTGTLGEACSNCHGIDKSQAVEKVHAR